MHSAGAAGGHEPAGEHRRVCVQWVRGTGEHWGYAEAANYRELCVCGTVVYERGQRRVYNGFMQGPENGWQFGQRNANWLGSVFRVQGTGEHRGIAERDADCVRGVSELRKLKKVEGLEKLTVVNKNTFVGCCTLQSVGDLSNVTSIGEWAFTGCSALLDVGELNSVTSIGESAFAGCSSLERIGDLPNIISIADRAFGSDYNGRDNYCTSLKTIGDMPKLKTIGNSAFSGCRALAHVGDMRNLESIGEFAFAGCASLENVADLPNLTSIGYYAFSGINVLMLMATGQGANTVRHLRELVICRN